MENYLNRTIECECGKIHKTDLKDIEISENALYKIPNLVRKYGYKKIFLVSDKNTYHVAAENIYQLLKEAGLETYNFVFQEDEIIPDETSVGKMVTNIDAQCDLVIGVGAGTINDLCKFVSFKMKIDYFIVATAPSMDGFASNVSAMITNNLKTTYETHVPKAIIGDLDILRQAPMNMIAAGVGDILGKYVSLLDWKIAHMIQGEYYCSYIEKMVQSSLQAVVASAAKVKSRDMDTIKYIMEALVVSGIAMSYAGNSRPASGSEHHLSHYWEMMFMFEHKAPILHGTKVGIGTVIAIKLYDKLRNTAINFEAAKQKAKTFKIEQWQEQIRLVYGVVAQEVIQFELNVEKNSPEKVIKRIEGVEQNWKEIMNLIDTQLPPVQELIELLQTMEAPTRPEQVGIDQQMLENSILYAKEIRNRYGLLQILFDLGLL